MKNIKTLSFFIAFMALNVFVFAQTKLIAHKSHSGKLSAFSINGEGNFGEGNIIVPKYTSKRITKISDNLFVEEGSFETSAAIHLDTLTIINDEVWVVYNNKPNTIILRDWNENMEFVGFSEVELQKLRTMFLEMGENYRGINGE